MIKEPDYMSYTLRPAADEYVDVFARYIERVPEGDLVDILRRQAQATMDLLRGLPAAKADWAYGEDKWTIKEVVGHISDVERVMSYRALRFARADETPLPSFDENTWTPAGRFGERSLDSLLDEFAAIRTATVALFGGIPHEAWTRRGIFSGGTFSVRAIACIICGHERHHRAVLEERYGLITPVSA
jgi:hypothetical protein